MIPAMRTRVLKHYNEAVNAVTAVHPHRIFIVDDDVTLLEELSHALAEAGHSVSVCCDAPRAVAVVAQTHPDIVILDLKMDGKSGFQIADDLKHLPETAHIPIIAVTGHFMERQHAAFMRQCGIDSCVLKPIDPQELMAAIDRVV